MKKEVCLKDFIAGGVVLLLAVVLFFLSLLFGENSDYVRITTEKSKQVYSLSENKEYTIDSNGHSLTVKIVDREVFVSSSTCADKVCVNSGKISHGGEIIVCAPALVSIELIGETEGVDYAVG
ncbi:MAG: NusG domain II-containing protein [Clostridia bacterium]|nr:NusG domain II-containing protein [Clostridia bacterium]